MSLISFHRALILLGILFCLLFAGWEVRAYAAGGAPLDLLLSAVFGFLGLLLTVYLARLGSILKLEE